MNTSSISIAQQIVKAANILLAEGGTHVALAELPPVLRRALKEVDYNKPSIEIIPATHFNLQGVSGDGQRSFFVLVNLKEDNYKVQYGSWGGANMSSTPNLVDNDSTRRELPDGLAVIQGTSGGNHPTWAKIYVNPTTIAPMLPAKKAELTPQEQKALNIIDGLTSAGRIRAFDDTNTDFNYLTEKPGLKLGKYGPNNPIIQSLIAKGLAKMTKSGALSLTLEGKNARTRDNDI